MLFKHTQPNSALFVPCVWAVDGYSASPGFWHFYLRMWGEFIGLKSALFRFTPALFPRSPTWGANMAWKRGMSSAPHLALLLRSELESPRGRRKKGIPHFHPDWDSPFLQQLQAAVIRIQRAQPRVLWSSLALCHCSLICACFFQWCFLGALLQKKKKKKKGQLHNGRRGPFLLSLPLSFSHSFLKLSDGAGLFNLPELFKMSLTSDGGDKGNTSTVNARRS